MRDFFNLLFATGPLEILGKDEVNGLTVSTVLTEDMGYETALLDKIGTHPVERYNTKEEAEIGHKKWCEFEGEEVTKLGYGELVEPEVIRLKR